MLLHAYISCINGEKMIKRKLPLILALFVFGTRAVHSEDVSSVWAYICQEHAVIGTQPYEKADKTFYGFYPPGQIENELREGAYTRETLEACQSVKVDLNEDQWMDLQIILENSRKLFNQWDSKKGGASLRRSIPYDPFNFNCVDFAQMVMGRYTGELLVETFVKQNHPLRLFGDPLEPSLLSGELEYCLHKGFDPAAYWAHYRAGTLNLLQAFFMEKPKAAFTAIAITGSALWGCHRAGYSYSFCFASIALMNGAVGICDFVAHGGCVSEVSIGLFILARVAMMAYSLIYSMNPPRPWAWRASYGLIILKLLYNAPDPMSRLVYPN